MFRFVCPMIFVFLTLDSPAQGADLTLFINRYKEIAIEEMHRTGIPASIKLAQAILESNAGNSELARKSNNFFGLKCGPEWEGPTYYKEDDDFDRLGRLVQSCFRVFDAPEASYIAHSEFLINPNKSYRYGWLFNLDTRDYKSWAWGLKESGYATNPKYAVLLIDLIERYELYTYDYYQPKRILASTSKQTTSEPKSVFTHVPIQKRNLRTATTRSKPIKKVTLIDGVVRNNGLDMIYAHEGETPLSVSEKYKRSLKDILAFNEALHSADQSLSNAERVYFEKKKGAYRGSRKYHIVLEGETMYEISQIYGIKLEKLYIRNRLFPGSEPAVGEKIRLKGMVRSKHRPKIRSATPSKSTTKVKSQQITVLPGKSRIKSSHVVKKGETLYRIAKNYQKSVKGLIRINDLTSSLIKPGQILRLE